MTEKKNAKYFVTSDKSDLKVPEYRMDADPDRIKKIVHLDADTVPGSEFYSEAMWILPGPEKEIKRVEAHTHQWGEFIGFFGYDYDDIQDLGAEIEFTVDGETHLITKSFAAFIPAGIPHGPLIIRNIRKPIMCYTGGDCERYE
jgi:hypothetical protein